MGACSAKKVDDGGGSGRYWRVKICLEVVKTIAQVIIDWLRDLR